MSDPNTTPTPDATPTEALPLAAEPQAVQPAAVTMTPPPAEHRSHTRTILEVVGGVVAAGLIVVAGAVGFFVGHATGSDNDGGRGGDRFAYGQDGGQFGPQADGGQRGQALPMLPGQPGQGQPGQGMPMMPGFGDGDRDGDRGFGRGVDPDGDNWTGQNQQQSPLDQAPPTLPGQ